MSVQAMDYTYTLHTVTIEDTWSHRQLHTFTDDLSRCGEIFVMYVCSTDSRTFRIYMYI